MIFRIAGGARLECGSSRRRAAAFRCPTLGLPGLARGEEAKGGSFATALQGADLDPRNCPPKRRYIVQGVGASLARFQ